MKAKFRLAKLIAGLSLIELMIIIAIGAFLLAIAIPSYQDYLQQTKVTEIFSIASEQMSEWEEHYKHGAHGFDIPYQTTGTCSKMGEYIDCVELLGGNTAPQLISKCPAGGFGGGNLGVVCLALNDDPNKGAGSIDPALEKAVVYFTPVATSTVSGDTSDTSISWSCNFVSTHNLANDTIIQGLLAPGNCTAD